jgi:PHD/YefM family antitoxin component YafN of YafNO toxin-antitoxin module
MKTVSLRDEKLDLEALIKMASKEPVLLLTADGKEFVLAEADDFDREVEILRGSQAFQQFLDERSRSTRRIPLEEIEAEIKQELEQQKAT